MHTVLSRSQFSRWRAAIFAIFLASGLSIATWASRVPGISEALGVNKAQIGILLLAMGIASITGISTSPIVSARLGNRLGMLLTMICFGIGVCLIGLGADVFGSVPIVVVGLVMFGFGNGSLDVMMNVEATAIEQRMGKTILPVFHAFFSFGTVIGAGAGALAAHLGMNVAAHSVIVGAVILVAAFVCFLQVPVRDEETGADSAGAGADAGSTGAGSAGAEADAPAKPAWRERLRVSMSAWREPRTYALGVVMLGMSFAEGGANDWIALGAVEGHGQEAGMGALSLAVFSVGMTVVRLAGGPLVDRFGRVAVLRVLAVAAASGILLFILSGALLPMLLGAALWGIGASLGFPLGMSAAADDPAKAAARVSAAATIGYVAFLGGPPVLGIISEQIGLLNTLYILVALVVLSGLFSGAARPLREDEKVG